MAAAGGWPKKQTSSWLEMAKSKVTERKLHDDGAWEHCNTQKDVDQLY